MAILNDTERDALTELGNIGVAKASVALAKLVGGEVRMSVPHVAVRPRAEAARGLEEAFSERLVAVSEAFEGALTGAALLVFPEDHCHGLVRAVLPHMADLDEIIEMEQEALSEIGNILINSCLSTLANMLRQRITTSLPRVVYGGAMDILPYGGGGDTDHVMIFHVDFTMRERGIKGFILIVMGVSSLMALRDCIAALVAPYADGADSPPDGAA